MSNSSIAARHAMNANSLLKGIKTGNKIVYGIKKTPAPVILFKYVCREAKRLYFHAANT